MAGYTRRYVRRQRSPRPLLIEQIFCAHLAELLKRSLFPVISDPSRVAVALDFVQHGARTHQRQRLINLEALGKELVERCRKLDSELRRVERVAIDQVDPEP